MRHRGPLPSVSSALAQSLQHLSPPFFHINAVAITPVFYEIKVPEPLYLSHFLFFIPKFTSLLFRNLLCYIPNPCVTLFRNSSVAFSDMTCWEFRAWTAPHSEMSGRKFRHEQKQIPTAATRHSEMGIVCVPTVSFSSFRNEVWRNSVLADRPIPKSTAESFRNCK